VTLTDAHGVIGVVDLHFDGTRVVVEIDGFRAHSSRRSFVNDRRRQNRLVVVGRYTVLRYTWEDLHFRPAEVIAEIREALRADRMQHHARTQPSGTQPSSTQPSSTQHSGTVLTREAGRTPA
jgi:uncharacterized protein DUF559